MCYDGIGDLRSEAQQEANLTKEMELQRGGRGCESTVAEMGDGRGVCRGLYDAKNVV